MSLVAFSSFTFLFPSLLLLQLYWIGWESKVTILGSLKFYFTTVNIHTIIDEYKFWKQPPSYVTYILAASHSTLYRKMRKKKEKKKKINNNTEYYQQWLDVSKIHLNLKSSCNGTSKAENFKWCYVLDLFHCLWAGVCNPEVCQPCPWFSC